MSRLIPDPGAPRPPARSPATDDDLARWLADLRARRRLTPDELAELADHLAESADRLQRAGVEPAVAARDAIAALGDTSHLILEFERNRSMTRPALARLAWLALAAVPLIVTAGSIGLDPLLDAPSLLLVAGFVATGLTASFGAGPVVAALRAIGGAPLTIDPALAREVFRRGHQLSWSAGVLGVVLGVMSALMNLADPAQLGPAIALCLVSLLYGAVFAELVFRNLVHWIPEVAPAAA